MRLLFFLFLASAAFLVVAAGSAAYKLDLKTPGALVAVYPDGPPDPSKVNIYRTGPQAGTEKRQTPESLSRRRHNYSVTNQSEIKELVSALRQSDIKARIPNASTRRGYTYHLLLFNNESMTVMHFRVFEPLDTNTVWAHVWPRSDTGFAYFNKEVVPWLKSHAVFSTNEPNASPKTQGLTDPATSK